ncbi:MAG: thioesterase [Trebouxia sp. A1-2]|nr:MAG: thioesterase [Trebouxia sp. A1-2]
MLWGRFPKLTGVLLNAQAGTGAWIFQNWWKSLPAYVEEAKRLGLLEPALLIVSANRAPHLAASHHDVDPTILHTLTYTDFWTAFERRYGTNPDLMDHRVKQMVWPWLQADFNLLETYQGTTSSTLTCPLIAVWALQDNRYTADQAFQAVLAFGKLVTSKCGHRSNQHHSKFPFRV